MTGRILFIAFVVANFTALNWSLVSGGGMDDSLAFRSERFEAGEFWLLYTYSFVHQGWVHLLFGAITTVCFLWMLPLRTMVGAFALAAIGTILLPLLITPESHHQVIAGISGIAHGLVVAIVWPMLRGEDKIERWVAWVLLVTLFAKVTYESVTGILVDFGLVAKYLDGFFKDGHLGGTLGVLGWCLLESAWDRWRQIEPAPDTPDPVTTPSNP